MMVARSFLPIAFLALAACQPAAERDAPEPAVSSTPADPTPAPSGNVVSPEQLAGEYRVAGVAGRDINLPYGITASVTADTIHLAISEELPDELSLLATLRVPTEGCARGLNEVEEALVEAFDGAERVSRTASNGYEFSGRGPTATLFTQ